MDFKSINLGEEIIKRNLSEIKISLEEDDIDPLKFIKEKNMTLLDLIEKKLSSIAVIVSFGEGYWGGADQEYTLIYRKENDKFFWIEIDYWEETLNIKFVEEDDKIFEYLKNLDKNNQQFINIDRYFREKYPYLPEATLDDIGFSDIPMEMFKYNIWWQLARSFTNTREILASQIKEQREKEKIKKVKEFYDKNKNKNMKLLLEGNKIFVVFNDEMKKELKL